jgi:phosphonate transport system permease protein
MTEFTEIPGAQAFSISPSERLQIDKESLRTQFLRPFPRIKPVSLLVWAVVLLVLAWAAVAVQPDMDQITRGKPPLVAVWDFVRGMFPAQYDYIDAIVAGISFSYPLALRYVVQTVQMALIGTLLGVLLSLPFGLLAARNTSPHPVVYQGTRLVLNAVRAVPELIWALVFVAAVGLGPFSGVLALAVAGIGSKGKLYAEAIEAIDPQQVMAVRATGAGRLQAFVYGVIPQALPLVLSYSLLSFEANVRAATILGYVGAGGIGLLLYQYIQLFQYTKLLGVVIITVISVTIIDRFSDFLRRKFI